MSMRPTQTYSEYRVEITFIAPSEPNGQRMQNFNHLDLDSMWRTITAYRGQPKVKRIRVYTLLATFEPD